MKLPPQMYNRHKDSIPLFVNDPLKTTMYDGKILCKRLYSYKKKIRFSKVIFKTVKHIIFHEPIKTLNTYYISVIDFFKNIDVNECIDNIYFKLNSKYEYNSIDNFIHIF